MKLKFRYGFTWGGFEFGWNKHELYRLPSTSGGKLYGLKKLSLIDIGSGQGYRIRTDKFTIQQLKDRTTEFEVVKEFKIINDTKDLPV